MKNTEYSKSEKGFKFPKIKINWIFVSIVIFSSIIGLSYNTLNEYTFKETSHKCYLKYKHHSLPSYRVSESFQFFLTDEKGRNFDLKNVHYSAYRSVSEKSYVTFKLRECEIKQNAKLDFLFVFYFVCWIVLIILIICYLVDLIKRFL